jgi:hypothetical protein
MQIRLSYSTLSPHTLVLFLVYQAACFGDLVAIGVEYLA